MSERGTFAIDRGWFDHPSFKDEPYTEREAWAWLIAQAAYRPHRRRIGAAEVSLARGQLAASLRFMGEKWKWSEPRVRRFLERLKTDAMIDAATDAGVTVITVRNYDKYQRPPSKIDAANDAATDAPPTQYRRKGEEREVRKEDEVGGTATPLITPAAFDLADAFAQAARIPEDQRAGLPYHAQVWITRGYDRSMILATGADIANRHGSKPVAYHAKAIQRVHEERANRPLAAPVVRVHPAQARSGGFAAVLAEKHQEAANAEA